MKIITIDMDTLFYMVNMLLSHDTVSLQTSDGHGEN